MAFCNAFTFAEVTLSEEEILIGTETFLDELNVVIAVLALLNAVVLLVYQLDLDLYIP